MLERLRMLRIRDGVSQKKLADMMQVSQQSINKYENHNVQPDLQTLIRFADFFHVSVDYLIGYSDIPARLDSMEEGTETEDEARTLTLYRQLTPQEKHSIKLILQNYCRNKTGSADMNQQSLIEDE